MVASALVIALGLNAASALVVDVQVIEASNKPGAHGGESKAIRDLGATLSYKSFQTVSQEQRTLKLGGEEKVLLPEGSVARISAVGVEEKKGKRTVRLRVRIEQGSETLDTEYSVRDGGTVFVSAGKSKSSDSALVLAISPRVQ